MSAPAAARFDRVLALCAGLVPMLAAVAAWQVSLNAGLIPGCNPLFDGCASISRAARDGTANVLFRCLMTGAALLQFAVWLRIARDTHRRRAVTTILLPWLGAAAALFLVLYVAWLGSDGAEYRWLRRYGVVGYFGATFLCMVLASAALRHLALAGSWPLPVRFQLLLPGWCLLTLALGLAQRFGSALLADAALRGRIENALEWQLGLAVCVFFLLLACLPDRPASPAEGIVGARNGL
jgi:hypothetical protein